MKCKIKHEIPGRIRLHAMMDRMSLEEADQLENYLTCLTGVYKVKVYERTCDFVICYEGPREELIKAIAYFRFDHHAMAESTPENSGRGLTRQYQEQIIRMVGMRVLNQIFLPSPIRRALVIVNSIRFIWKGIK